MFDTGLALCIVVLVTLDTGPALCIDTSNYSRSRLYRDVIKTFWYVAYCGTNVQDSTVGL